MQKGAIMMSKQFKKGDKIPNFTYRTAYEENLHLYDALKGKTFFIVHRYIGCPICRLDVQELMKQYDKLTAKGAQAIVVMQSDPEHVRADLASTGTTLPFPIICDTDQEIYKTLNVRPAVTMISLVGLQFPQLLMKFVKANRSGIKHGDFEGNEQQRPALFLLDEDGTILKAHYAKTLTDLPNVDGMVKML